MDTSPPATASAQTLDGLSAIERQVLDAQTIIWGYESFSNLLEVLRWLFAWDPDGRAFTHEKLKLAHKALRQQDLLEEETARPGRWRVREPLRSSVYLALLERLPGSQLRHAVFSAARYSPKGPHYGWSVSGVDASAAVLRVALLTDTPAAELVTLESQFRLAYDQAAITSRAFGGRVDDAIFRRMPGRWRDWLVGNGLGRFAHSFDATQLPVFEWVLASLQRPGCNLPPHLRYQTVEILLHQGKADAALGLLAGSDSMDAKALRAAALVQDGRWQEAEAEFDAAMKALKKEHGGKAAPLPYSLTQYHVLALLAQQTPRAQEAARKFCLTASRSRNPSPHDGWGLWVHAVNVRLGNTALERTAFRLRSRADHIDPSDVWRCWLRAWLGLAPERKDDGTDSQALTRLRAGLQGVGFAWIAQQLEAAETVYRGGEPPPNCFIPCRQENWRTVLASLQALAGEEATGKAESSAPSSRILWSLNLDPDGSVLDIEPLEQKRGARGWGKPKALGLSRLAGNENLDPWDHKVARAVRESRYASRLYTLDRAAAITALIGHPAVVLGHDFDETVDLVEGTPEMEVVRRGDSFTLRVNPPLREAEPEFFRDDTEQRREADALSLITVLQDSPRRLRVVRFTPAQRRAAILLAGKVSVPASAEAELEKTLQLLTSHFQVHGDSARAAREVETDSRLRAELSPTGEGLLLRLVAAPLGDDGPRLMPGVGRERIMAALRGEGVGTRRDLKVERAHLDAVLDALPFLDPPARGDQVAEWQVDEPEQALSLVETLPQLPAVAALDWPKGKPVRVHTVDARQLGVSVRTDRDWFALSGQVRLDEGLVLELEQLLEWSASGRGRFLPMGAGTYAALTEHLRAQLADLAAVAEIGKDGARIPQLAAAWLEQALEGTEATLDKAFRHKVDRLRAAQDQTHSVPRALQAQLRPYQEDGYGWAMRLADAGFGACLADDMGLGKTLQALAVLLARAGGGAALVVAPTSVCGNWLAEAGRFAPTLNFQYYGEGDRAGMITAAAPGDVILVSYGLMQQAAEAFAARSWHTLVVDEAQAVKNAQAKRSQALFDLPADFRLALSGTPVENRLAELWSIMRFCNPGLLGTLTRFNQRFATPIERDRDRDTQHLLRRLIAPFLLRRTKAQVLQELPPRTEQTLTIVPEAAEAAHYEALRRQALAETANSLATESAGQTRFVILAQLTRLRRAACDPRLTSPQLGIVGAKLRAFAELATELSANGHKALVFSQFVDFLTLLREPLDQAGIAYQYLDGSTPAAERTRRVAAFQKGEGDLFLISLKAGGFGLNLTAADYVVIADPWWNPAAEDQAMGRAHRIGQQRPVTVYRLVLKASLEEHIVSLLGEKRALAEGILAEGEGAVLPSTDDLLALIRGAQA
ncbi:MAG: DEAD/DEAH box helicase [Rhodocyclaceae bacterium]|nr:DEAD/DEAH box helicase [Rhodocyclaceae bacterium]MBX3670218.1 DEAD/DEAH box helicase [Rhodocyclaceae bacterium]